MVIAISVQSGAYFVAMILKMERFGVFTAEISYCWSAVEAESIQTAVLRGRLCFTHWGVS